MLNHMELIWSLACTASYYFPLGSTTQLWQYKLCSEGHLHGYMMVCIIEVILDKLLITKVVYRPQPLQSWPLI